MIALARIITTFEGELRAHYGKRLLPSQHQALAALKHCRSARSPRMQVQCADCHQQTTVPHSCGHRSCPHCQHHESEQWLQRQLQRQVPAEYFLLTFTLPAQLRALAWERGRQEHKRLRLRGFGQLSRSFSSNSYGYSPQTIEKSDQNHFASLAWFLPPKLRGSSAHRLRCPAARQLGHVAHIQPQ